MTDPDHAAQPQFQPDQPAQQQYVQPQYAQPQYVQAQPMFVVQTAPPRGLSITSMVLGLASILFGFTFFVPIAAFIFGIIGLKKEPAGKGMAMTGLIIGSLFLIFWVLVLFGGPLLLLIFGGVAGLSGVGV